METFRQNSYRSRLSAAGLRGRCIGLLKSVIRSFPGNAPELPDGFIKSSPCLGAAGFCDCSLARSPELLDGFDAPKGAGPRYPDRLAGHQHIDRIRVKLGKLSKRDPGALVDLNFQVPIVNLTVRQNLLARDRLSIDHNLDETLAALDDFIRAQTVQGDRVTDEPLAVRRDDHAVCNRSRQFRRECDLRPHPHLAR